MSLIQQTVEYKMAELSKRLNPILLSVTMWENREKGQKKRKEQQIMENDTYSSRYTVIISSVEYTYTILPLCKKENPDVAI